MATRLSQVCCLISGVKSDALTQMHGIRSFPLSTPTYGEHKLAFSSGEVSVTCTVKTAITGELCHNVIYTYVSRSNSKNYTTKKICLPNALFLLHFIRSNPFKPTSRWRRNEKICEIGFTFCELNSPLALKFYHLFVYHSGSCGVI